MRHLNKQSEKNKPAASSITPTTEQGSPGQSESPSIAPMPSGIPLSELQEAIPPSAGEASDADKLRSLLQGGRDELLKRIVRDGIHGATTVYVEPEAEPGRQEFIDRAATEIYARHFQFPKCYQQATDLWEARKTWLAGKWTKPTGTFAGNTRLP